MNPGSKRPFTLARHALLMPLEGCMDEFRSGVFVDGVCLEDSLMDRARAAVPRPPETELRGSYLFGGYLFANYGHFLLESLARLYALRQCGSYPLLFMSPNASVATWQRHIFKLLDVGNDILLIHRPTRVERLAVAPPGCSLARNLLTPEQRESLARVSVAGPVSRKIWLSRSAFKHGEILNEREIEADIARHGWDIVHPEQLPIRTQVELVASSALVAGLDGSAFYTALLARKVWGRFFVFSRRKRIPPMLSTVLRDKGVSVEEFIFPVEFLDPARPLSKILLSDVGRITDILNRL